MRRVEKLISFIRKTFNSAQDFIPLHEPFINGNEQTYLLEALAHKDFSSNALVVTRFEKALAEKINVNHVIATNTGTSALQLALLAAGVEKGTEVITQSLSFIATANSIKYCEASPVFLDVDRETLGLSPEAVLAFLEKNALVIDGKCVNKNNGKRITAILPMHTFGIPMQINSLLLVARKYGIPVIEDSAEALGSTVNGKSLGTFGKAGIFSFNGNKILTSGGGGAVVTNDAVLAERVRFLSTTAKTTQGYNLIYNELGYNYRMPGLNASLALAQLEYLPEILVSKRLLHQEYLKICKEIGLDIVSSTTVIQSNCWLNTICLRDKTERSHFIEMFNKNGVEARPVWSLIHEMPYFNDCYVDSQKNAKWLSDRLAIIPSGSRE